MKWDCESRTMKRSQRVRRSHCVFMLLILQGLEIRNVDPQSFFAAWQNADFTPVFAPSPAFFSHLVCTSWSFFFVTVSFSFAPVSFCSKINNSNDF